MWMTECVRDRTSGTSSSAVTSMRRRNARKCFAKFYCSGGCAANSYNFHGNINDAYDVGCELQRKRIECAIMLKVAQMEEESEEE